MYTFNHEAICIIAQLQVVQTTQYTTSSFLCSTQKVQTLTLPQRYKLYKLPNTLPHQKCYDKQCQGFDWFTNLLQTTHASCAYLHNIVAHELITAWDKLISSLSRVMQNTCISCLLNSWMGLVDFIIYYAHTLIYVFYLLHFCFARNHYIHCKVRLIRVHFYYFILETTHHSKIGEFSMALLWGLAWTRRTWHSQ